MKQKHFFYLLMLIILATTNNISAQTYQLETVYGRDAKRALIDSTLRIPRGLSTRTNASIGDSAGLIAMKDTADGVYYFTGQRWKQLAGSSAGIHVDSVTTNSDSTILYYWINGTSTRIVDLTLGVTGGDTTVYNTVLDTTGAVYQRVIVAGPNRKLAGYREFIYDSATGIVRIQRLPSAPYSDPGLIVDGSIHANGLKAFIKTELYNDVYMQEVGSSGGALSDSASVRPLAIDPATGKLYRLAYWPVGSGGAGKLNISDTAAMMANAVRRISASGDTAYYNNSTGNHFGFKFPSQVIAWDPPLHGDINETEDTLFASFDTTNAVTPTNAHHTYGYYLTKFVDLNGSYSNPSWINSLPWSKITGTPTTIAGYGITDFNSLGDARWEANTASNLAGAGIGIYKDKSGVDLRFKRLKAGVNTTITDNGDSVTIATSAASVTSPKIGTINGYNTKSANGAVISTDTLYMQTADTLYPGLMSAALQRLKGGKQLMDSLIIGEETTSARSGTMISVGTGTPGLQTGLGRYTQQVGGQRYQLDAFIPTPSSTNIGQFRWYGGGQYNASKTPQQCWMVLDTTGATGSNNVGGLLVNVPIIAGQKIQPFDWNTNATGTEFMNLGIAGSLGNLGLGAYRRTAGGNRYRIDWYLPTGAGTQKFRWYGGGVYNDGLSDASCWLVVDSAAGSTIKTSLSVGDGAVAGASAIASFNSTTKGVLITRGTTANRDAIATPANTLLFANTSRSNIGLYNSTPATWGEIYASKYTLATDAAYTFDANTSIVNLPTITANRIVTLPSAATYVAKELIIKVANSAGFTWSTNTNIFDKTDTGFTALTNDTVYRLFSDGTSWFVTSIY